ncbi:hypothetical protein DRO42_05780 [Candidatus Bathyarchaeota archaeon]|nr:MAG: hypothetical protein DRO42_05780 [Candidatus Bathyarchaeota archaeon]
MIILLYFDWAGSRAELKEYNEKIKAACEQVGVRFMGIYGSMNVKWNFVSMFEVESYEHFLKMGRQVSQHPAMTHYITEILIPQKL